MLSLLACCCILLATQAAAQNWNLVWEDNFDGDSIDFNKWDHEVTAWGGGNFEFEVYTPDPVNSYVRDGILYLKPTLLEDNINPLTGDPFGSDFLYNGILDLWAMYGSCTQGDNNGCYWDANRSGFMPPTMSARLRTYERFSFSYGRIEVSAKMPSGDWMWPAIWMLPEDWVYGGWPKSGEIDIVECIGNNDLTNEYGEEIGNSKMGSTLHWGASSSENRFYLTTESRRNTTDPYGNSFHKYVVEWDDTGLSYWVDDTFLVSFPSPPIDENPDWEGWGEFGAPWPVSGWHPWGDSLTAPFDEQFHFLLNVAVGGLGGFIPDNVENGDGGRKPWDNGMGWGQAMESFYNDRGAWYPTWSGEDGAMQVDYVRVYELGREGPTDDASSVRSAEMQGL